MLVAFINAIIMHNAHILNLVVIMILLVNLRQKYND